MTHDSELREALDLLAAPAAAHAPDWPSIARRSRRAARRRLLLTIATILLAIAVTAPALGVDDRLLGLVSGDPIEEESLSTRDWYALNLTSYGGPATPGSARWRALRLNAEGMLRNLGDLGVNEVRLLAEREGRAFYVIGDSAPHCYSIGSATSPARLGSITCLRGSNRFPSRAEPIYDESVFHGPVGAGRVLRLEGFAVSGVTSVGIIGTDGVLRAVTPVESNVYVRTRDLPEVSTRDIVALDADGNPLFCWFAHSADCEVRR